MVSVLDDRFRRLWDSARLPELDAFDCANDAHVDELACLLLERFRNDGDAEAFTLLFQVTGPRLERIARRLLDRHARALPSAQLVEDFKRQIFLHGPESPPLLVGSFLALARSHMERSLKAPLAPPRTSRPPKRPRGEPFRN
ncbi:MAG TPA: hypothetical protein VK824_04820 [Planctomycetota bacterium]|nr:hypothetical protein [Planctomycetota bacterium]